MTLTPNDIRHEAHANGGNYLARLDGIEEAAVLEYSNGAEPGHIVAEHTSVPESMRGRGIARILVERLVQDARAHGWRIHPKCPYVRTQAERTPEWANVFIL